MSFHRQRARFLYLALFLFIFFALCAQSAFADFKFAVIGDTQGNNEDGINFKVSGKLMEIIKSEKVDFILVSGDMVTGSNRSSKHIKQLKKWKSFIDAYEISAYCVAGNHVIQSETSEDIFRSIFELPDNGPEDFKELVYSFDYQNAHFVAVHTEEYGNFHNIGEEQFRWLCEDLGKIKNRAIFVFGHDPAYPRKHINDSLDRFPARRDEMWSLFKEKRVKVYFCGHDHLYDRSLRDGVYQIITGGGGGHLYAAPDEGGFHHFIMVEVRNNGSSTVVVKDIDGAVRDSFIIE
jgi:3',5'-cyclic AMP phosphodiesterase CpdA